MDRYWCVFFHSVIQSNVITPFLEKFEGGSGPPDPPSGSAHGNTSWSDQEEEGNISDEKETAIATASEVEVVLDLAENQMSNHLIVTSETDNHEVVPDLAENQTSNYLIFTSETDNNENFYELPTQLSTLSSRLMDLMNLSENSTEGEQDGTMEPVNLSENSSEMKQGKDTKDMHSAQDRLHLSTFGLAYDKSFHVRNEHKIWDPGKEF